MKRCTICGETKPYSEFIKQASRRDGFGNRCTPCRKIKKREEYLRNRDKRLAAMKAYREANPEKVAESKKRAVSRKPDHYRDLSRSFYERNREARIEYAAQYRVDNWERVLKRNTAYKLRRMKEDPLFRAECAMRGYIRIAFKKRGHTKTGTTRALLGCEWDELKAHMERQFKPGMTWDNYGEWHIDHILPLASAETVDDLARLCHYKNLQPLWAEDNIRKGAKVPEAA